MNSKDAIANKRRHFTPKRLVGYLLSLVFLAIAVWAFVGIASDVRDWLWVRNAIETTADRISYKHEYVSSGNGRQRRTTFDYTYSVAGKQFRNVSRHVGPFTDRKEIDQVIDLVESRGPVVCYVHPDDPSQSLLSRNVSKLRLAVALLFAGGFALAGFCILWSCVSKRYAHQF